MGGIKFFLPGRGRVKAVLPYRDTQISAQSHGKIGLLATHEPPQGVRSQGVIIHIQYPTGLAADAENHIMVQFSGFVAHLARS